jgi:hypothetical protein
MGLHDPFGHLKHKLWPKERLRVKLAVWLLTIKSQESTRFPCVQWCVTYHCKALDRSYNFVLDFILIKGLHIKLRGPKVAGIPILGISGLPLSQPHFEGSVKSPLTLPKMRLGSPLGFLKTQNTIAGVKTPRIERFFIPLERSWSFNVQNDLAWAIWTFKAQVMVERKAGSQTCSLTPDHKKLRINLIPVCAGGVQYTVGKLSRRATSLLQTSLQSEVRARSYERPKSREFKPG